MLFDQGELQFEKKRIGACAISLSILFTTLWNKLTSGSFIFKLHCGLFQFCLYALQLQRCVLFLLVFFFFTQLLSLIAFPLGCLVLILCQEFDPLSNRQYYFLCVCVQAENRPYFINCSNISSTDGDDPQSPVPSIIGSLSLVIFCWTRHPQLLSPYKTMACGLGTCLLSYPR